MEVHKKSKNKTNIWSSKSTLGYISRKKKKTLIWKDTCTPMFLAALCTRAKIWKQPKCPLAEEWVEHSGYNRIFSSVQSLSRVWLLATPWTLCSMTGLPVHHQTLEFTQTQVHQVSDAIQPSHPLLSPSPPALNLSQHQGLFKWVRSLHQVAKVLEFQFQHQSFQWTLRTDLL